MPQIPRALLDEFRLQIEDIFNSALPVNRIAEAGHFTAADEKEIAREVRRLTYEPELPHGGSRERRMVERFWALSERTEWAGCGRAVQAAKAFQEIDGWYYKRTPLFGKSDEKEIEFCESVIKSAREFRLWEQKWFAEEMLKGLPERVANFHMECKFLLRKADGKIERIVNMVNSIGETSKMVAIDSEAFAAPKQFRIWLNNTGYYVWEAGEREMNKLQLDVGNDAAYKDVYEIVSLGWHPIGGRLDEGVGFSPQKGIWFLGDCAYGPRGELLEPDDQGVYTYEDKGYMLAEKGRESIFLQGKPLLKPGLLLSSAPWQADVHDTGMPPEQDLMREFFQDLSVRFQEAVGGPEACLMLGTIFSYAAAPEIFSHHTQFPGMWVHGQAASGKSTAVDWMMRLCGFTLGKGLDLTKNVSPTSMLMAANMYSNLPIWMDEFRINQVEDAKVSVLRSAFMRALTAKWTPDGMQREMKTNFVVSGETTSDDAATRGRFPHVQMAESKRRGNHMPWFRERRDWFFVFFRHLMQNRPAYTALVMEEVEKWCSSVTSSKIPERDRLVHGISYAGYVGMARLLQSHAESDFESLRGWLVEYAGGAAEDVKSELNVNVWWDELITSFNAGEIDLKNFKVEVAARHPHPPGNPNQGAWISYHLFIAPKAVIAEMAIYMGKQHSKIPIKQKDIRDQASKNSYWLGSDFNRRMCADSHQTKVWGIALDEHPLGRLTVSDEEYQSYLEDRTQGDPRKGPLFAIVNKLIADKQGDIPGAD
jgi:hypothetical protein